MKRALIAAVLGLAVFLPSAQAAKPQPFALETLSLSRAAIVEQQTPNWSLCWQNINDPACDQSLFVTNPTLCMWDVDDTWQAGGFGSLEAGGVRSVSQCVISDHAHRLVGVWAYAGSPDLVVRLTYEPHGLSFTLTPVKRDRKTWDYKGCVIGPRYSDESSLPEIEGSNGGHGVLGTVTLAVENPTGRVLRDTFAQALAGSDAPGAIRQSYCKGERIPFMDGGAMWKVAL